MSDTEFVGAYYLNIPVTNMQAVIDKARKSLTHPDHPIDCLVGTGLSGAMVVPLLAHTFGLRWMIIRKDDDKSTHSSSRVEGTITDGQRWVFVDDFKSSGATRKRVGEVMASVLRERRMVATYVGDYFYVDSKGLRFSAPYLRTRVKEELEAQL